MILEWKISKLTNYGRVFNMKMKWTSGTLFHWKDVHLIYKKKNKFFLVKVIKSVQAEQQYITVISDLSFLSVTIY